MSAEPVLPEEMAGALAEYGRLRGGNGVAGGEPGLHRAALFARREVLPPELADRFWRLALEAVARSGRPDGPAGRTGARPAGADYDVVLRDTLDGALPGHLLALRLRPDGSVVEGVPRTVLLPSQPARGTRRPPLVVLQGGDRAVTAATGTATTGTATWGAAVPGRAATGTTVAGAAALGRAAAGAAVPGAATGTTAGGVATGATGGGVATGTAAGGVATGATGGGVAVRAAVAGAAVAGVAVLEAVAAREPGGRSAAAASFAAHGAERRSLLIDSARDEACLVVVDGTERLLAPRGAWLVQVDPGSTVVVDGARVRLDALLRPLAAARLRLVAGMPCRWSVTGEDGVGWFPPGVPHRHDHRGRPYFHGDDLVVEVPARPLTVTAARGMEYAEVGVEVVPVPGREHLVELTPWRLYDAAARGWYGGDLHVHLGRTGDLAGVPAAQHGEDLHVLNLLTTPPGTAARDTLERWTGRDLPWSDATHVARIGIEYRNDLLGHIHAFAPRTAPTHLRTAPVSSSYPAPDPDPVTDSGSAFDGDSAPVPGGAFGGDFASVSGGAFGGDFASVSGGSFGGDLAPVPDGVLGGHPHPMPDNALGGELSCVLGGGLGEDADWPSNADRLRELRGLGALVGYSHLFHAPPADGPPPTPTPDSPADEAAGPRTGPAAGPLTSPAGPLAGPVARPLTSPTTDPLADPTTDPLTGSPPGPLARPTTDPLTGSPPGPLADPAVDPFTGSLADPAVGPFTSPVTGSTEGSFTDPLAGPPTDAPACAVPPAPRDCAARELVADAALGLVDSLDVLTHASTHASDPAAGPFTAPLTDPLAGPLAAPAFVPAAAAVYRRLIGAGNRLAVTAGTDATICPAEAGDRSNPPGWARVYARVEGELTARSFAAAVRAGRTFVTTGPWLELSVDGHGPGEVVEARRGDTIRVTAAALGPEVAAVRIRTADGVRAGAERLPFEGARAGAGETLAVTAELRVDGPTYVLAEVLCDPHPRTLAATGYAMTSPVHVDVDGRRVARPEDVRWCLEWLDLLEELIRQHARLAGPYRFGEHMSLLEQARGIYRARLARA
ncbi:CehA/McbA family metallohydrolase [Nonomuraea sp. NPDC050783]|uniref:CehA/McbA family metallohydrolase n=1 Tax=Nonomuraea sp. NPDC050783 TaxID=3154634 RepID=UPI00346603C4